MLKHFLRRVLLPLLVVIFSFSLLRCIKLFLVPESLIGQVLGKKGSTIREIQQLSGAKVVVSARSLLWRIVTRSHVVLGMRVKTLLTVKEQEL